MSLLPTWPPCTTRWNLAVRSKEQKSTSTWLQQSFRVRAATSSTPARSATWALEHRRSCPSTKWHTWKSYWTTTLPKKRTWQKLHPTSRSVSSSAPVTSLISTHFVKRIAAAVGAMLANDAALPRKMMRAVLEGALDTTAAACAENGLATPLAWPGTSRHTGQGITAVEQSLEFLLQRPRSTHAPPVTRPSCTHPASPATRRRTWNRSSVRWLLLPIIRRLSWMRLHPWSLRTLTDVVQLCTWFRTWSDMVLNWCRLVCDQFWKSYKNEKLTEQASGLCS